jgi:hypothetical protein
VNSTPARWLSLVADHAQARYFTASFSCRVRLDGSVLGHAYRLQTFSSLRQHKTEIMGAQTAQGRFHPINDAVPLTDQALPLAVRPLGVFLSQGWNRDHLAMIPLALQPPQEGALQHLCIQLIGLYASISHETATLAG